MQVQVHVVRAPVHVDLQPAQTYPSTFIIPHPIHSPLLDDQRVARPGQTALHLAEARWARRAEGQASCRVDVFLSRVLLLLSLAAGLGRPRHRAAMKQYHNLIALLLRGQRLEYVRRATMTRGSKPAALPL